MLLDRYLVIVLAAGLGKRLAPLTRILPKPCLPLLGQPLCMGMIDQLIAAGASRIHVNVSYLSENLVQELSAALVQRYPRDLHRVRFWTEPQRLETGGAIIRIWRHLGREDPNLAATTKGVLVVSGDLVGDLPLGPMVHAWEQAADQHNSDALMVYHETPPGWEHSVWVQKPRNGLGARIKGFGRAQPEAAGEVEPLHGADFANYQIIGVGALDELTGDLRQVSSTDLIYRPLLSQGRHIAAIELPEGSLWHNVGTPRDYADCLKTLMARSQRIGDPMEDDQATVETAHVEADAVTAAGMQSVTLDNVLIQNLRTTPRLVSVSEFESIPFDQAFARFAEALNQLSHNGPDRYQKKAAPLVGAERPQLVIRIPLVPKSLLHAWRPILVGAADFLEMALSQRWTREAPGDWAALLFDPLSRPDAREPDP